MQGGCLDGSNQKAADTSPPNQEAAKVKVLGKTILVTQSLTHYAQCVFKTSPIKVRLASNTKSSALLFKFKL